MTTVVLAASIVLGSIVSCSADGVLPSQAANEAFDASSGVRQPSVSVSRKPQSGGDVNAPNGGVNRLRSMRGIPSDTIAAWSRILDDIARRSPRGESSVTMRRQVLRALAAPSDAEFRAIVRQLPVTVTNVAASRDGARGFYRQYSVRGVVRLSLFIPTAHASEASSSWGAQTNSGQALPAMTQSESVCEYNSPVSGYISGECATQQEIDDAAYMVATQEDELLMANDMNIDVGGCDAYGGVAACESHEDAYDAQYGPQRVAAPNRGSAVVGESRPASRDESEREDESLSTSDEVEESGEPLSPYHIVSDEPSSDTCSAFDSAPADITVVQQRTKKSCLYEASQAALGVVFFVGSKAGALAVMTAANPPAGAIAWAVIGALGSGYAAAGGLMSYYDCKISQK